VVKKDLLNELLQSNHTDLAERDARIASLQAELQAVQKTADNQLALKAIYREVRAQFPQALQVNVSAGFRSVTVKPGAAATERPLVLVQLYLRDALGVAEQERLRLGLRTRAGLTDVQDVRLEVSVVKPVVKKKKTR